MTSNKPPILLTLLVLALLGSSITLNFLLFNRGKQYYLELNLTRLDPLGWNAYPLDSNPPPKTNSRVRLVFFGDSRAASWLSPDMEGYEFINRGIGSQTSIQTLQRFEQHIKPLEPDIVLIQVGVNDLKTIALFPKRKELTLADCKTNIQQIVEQSKALGAVVILTPILPVGEIPLERKPFWSDDVTLAIKEVNTYINSLASENVIIFDPFSILVDEKGVVKREYSKDELHLNSQGYKVLNQEFIQFLNSL
ncbi:MAG: GDSL-type esterase/lipase family protein [Limnoraphis robusta]|uniref:GDSL-type esterase/lipase family protein n=1 Tax=Limnoraphis robusta TaxID=1118279 RepID=UPI002B1F1729|nr:GDSL-type esterase/lipase family protein [Limnoraphis robusta]MEA5501298.1 GDSL-type esterase/lipase family protein [Limnoraphis robusta BA-68 BA1]MEA5540896.1 GDSL-type esterase/lipase family protein [Limnoraphis robusta Tam1]